MFSKKIDLFAILGFRVSLDLSWFILAILIVWSLATGYFPAVIEGLGPELALLLGIIGALGLFASIILHEFSHAIVARHFDIPISGITLFIFGGVAEMEDAPPSAKSEFLMAIAGPVASYVLAFVFFTVNTLLPVAAPLAAVFDYLAVINMVLATFNLIPAFPLDGGRVFRAALWWWTGDLAKATRIAAAVGRVFGTLLIGLGVLNVVTGGFVTGMWQVLIGLFIIGAARSSELQLIMKTYLQDVPVRRIMVPDPITVEAHTPVNEVIEDFFYRFGHKVFPVLSGSEIIGCVSLEDVGKVAPENRSQLTVGDILSRGSVDRLVTPGMSVLDALELMRRHDTSRLMVAENGRLTGMLTMRDILDYVTIHRELADAGRHRGQGAA